MDEAAEWKLQEAQGKGQREERPHLQSKDLGDSAKVSHQRLRTLPWRHPLADVCLTPSPPPTGRRGPYGELILFTLFADLTGP